MFWKCRYRNDKDSQYLNIWRYNAKYIKIVYKVVCGKYSIEKRYKPRKYHLKKTMFMKFWTRNILNFFNLQNSDTLIQLNANVNWIIIYSLLYNFDLLSLLWVLPMTFNTNKMFLNNQQHQIEKRKINYFTSTSFCSILDTVTYAILITRQTGNWRGVNVRIYTYWRCHHDIISITVDNNFILTGTAHNIYLILSETDSIEMMMLICNMRSTNSRRMFSFTVILRDIEQMKIVMV